MNIDPQLLRKIIEGALMASSEPLNVNKIQSLFNARAHDELELEDQESEIPEKDEILAVLEDIQNDTVDRGFELKEVGSGWRFQIVQETAPWINKLWEEKPPKYSRALLETLSLIAYRQPITRGDIESIRGVAVSSNIIRTLTDRDWVKVVGHRDVPGRPALYATTKEFLDYFNIKSLEELPSLKEIQDIDKVGSELELLIAGETGAPKDSENLEDSEAGQSDSEQSHAGDSESSAESEVAAEAEVSESDTDLSMSADDENDEPKENETPSNVVHLDTHS